MRDLSAWCFCYHDRDNTPLIERTKLRITRNARRHWEVNRSTLASKRILFHPTHARRVHASTRSPWAASRTATLTAQEPLPVQDRNHVDHGYARVNGPCTFAKCRCNDPFRSYDVAQNQYSGSHTALLLRCAWSTAETPIASRKRVFYLQLRGWPFRHTTPDHGMLIADCWDISTTSWGSYSVVHIAPRYVPTATYSTACASSEIWRSGYIVWHMGVAVPETVGVRRTTICRTRPATLREL
jgi:hypothetical protein